MQKPVTEKKKYFVVRERAVPEVLVAEFANDVGAAVAARDDDGRMVYAVEHRATFP